MVAITIDDSHLARLEGRVDEMSEGIQDLRAGQRELNGRVDRLFLGIMGIGATLIGLMVTLVVTVILRVG